MSQIQGALIFLMLLVVVFNAILFLASLKLYTEVFKELQQRRREQSRRE